MAVVGNRTQTTGGAMILLNLLSVTGIVDEKVITPEMVDQLNQVLTGAIGLFLALKVKNGRKPPPSDVV